MLPDACAETLAVEVAVAVAVAVAVGALEAEGAAERDAVETIVEGALKVASAEPVGTVVVTAEFEETVVPADEPDGAAEPAAVPVEETEVVTRADAELAAVETAEEVTAIVEAGEALSWAPVALGGADPEETPEAVGAEKVNTTDEVAAPLAVGKAEREAALLGAARLVPLDTALCTEVTVKATVGAPDELPQVVGAKDNKDSALGTEMAVTPDENEDT